MNRYNQPVRKALEIDQSEIYEHDPKNLASQNVVERVQPGGLLIRVCFGLDEVTFLTLQTFQM